MKANELRIGNLVSKGNEWYVTDFITIKMAHNYNPIPLTPEILEMCGFKKNINGFHKMYDITFLSRQPHFKDGYTVFIKGQSIKTIFFIHELQNLYFALTGKELPVNLSEPASLSA